MKVRITVGSAQLLVDGGEFTQRQLHTLLLAVAAAAGGTEQVEEAEQEPDAARQFGLTADVDLAPQLREESYFED